MKFRLGVGGWSCSRADDARRKQHAFIILPPTRIFRPVLSFAAICPHTTITLLRRSIAHDGKVHTAPSGSVDVTCKAPAADKGAGTPVQVVSAALKQVFLGWQRSGGAAWKP